MSFENSPLSDAGLMSIGHAIAIWSDERKLLACNPSFSRQFDLGPTAGQIGLNQEAFFEDAKERGILITMSTEPDPDWLGDNIEAPGTRLRFSDGANCLLESWPMAKGGSVMMLRDVTEADRTETALVKARDAAKAADQSKSRFLRAANHDLRQPLAALKILIYSCFDADTSEDRKQALHAMDVSVSIMEDLLGALLNIGQLDAGKIQPNIQTFQISTIQERLRVQFDHQAREKGLDLRIVPSAAPIVSDRVLLERILSNFVSNAIRYTDTGRVIMGCKRAGKYLRLMVIDTGTGIEEQFHEAIFQEFFRITEKQVAGRHSLGLGLNISRRLADMLGHKQHVSSSLGKGSVFSIDVPIGNVIHSSIGEPEISESIGGQFAGLACLLLEDDINLRNALTTLLERWGIIVMPIGEFDNVELSIASLEHAPDIIITDYRLAGGIQGPDVAGEINARLKKPCPTLVMTADTSPDLIQAIRNRGFPVMIKPVSPPSLRVMMHNLLFEPGSGAHQT